MTSPELVEEVLDDPQLLRARDPRGLLPAVAGAGAQVRETASLTDEAGLGRITDAGRPRGLVVVARREGAVAGGLLRALLGPGSPVAVDVVPGPRLPVWTGASDVAVVATRTGAGSYAVAPAYEALRRGVAVLGIGADGAPLHAACAGGRAPYVPLPPSRVQHTSLWSLLTPMLQLAGGLGLLPDGAAGTDEVAAALDAVAADCGPVVPTYANPAKTLALELLDALPVVVAEGPLAAAAGGRVADQLATLAGLPAAAYRLPEQRAAACTVLGGPLAPVDGDDFFRDRADDTGRRLRLLTVRDEAAGADDGPAERDPRSAADALRQVLTTATARTVPVSGLADRAGGEGDARLARVARQVAVGDFAAVYLALALDAERGRDPGSTLLP
ncbi:phospho-glucose isomerase C-terminal SIS domain-containing protein [Klenkia marina]|uniref:Phospho-glucose isomerase C-terminal SIS domain-containing protein n=1 Tax=Klenkia marina TaxID=1960309 RepID=A0A1G4YEA4_9ACTN|nr:SIS domain-containing protein [Klenkia marina]SCX51890.1 phospho-glucose isomerase C-terminal SIS domain-containing protein [Klenkia marina]